MIPSGRKRLPLEAPLVRVVATGGIVGIGVVIAAIMTSQDSEGWLIGLVVSIVSVVLAAVLWSSRRPARIELVEATTGDEMMPGPPLAATRTGRPAVSYRRAVAADARRARATLVWTSFAAHRVRGRPRSCPPTPSLPQAAVRGDAPPLRAADRKSREA
jgi:hypothetical protein